MAEEPDALESEFLKTHRLGILATGKRDGSPQQSLIAYNYDGNDIVISTGDQAAKYKNLRKRPSASLIVTDGPKAVTIYGAATFIYGDAADAVREARLQPPRPAGNQPARPAPNRGERLIIRIAPAAFFSNRLDD